MGVLFPTVQPPVRIAALATLPVSLDLAGRRAVVVGQSPAIARKVELLAAAGAMVDVFACRPHRDLETAAAVAGNAATLHRRGCSTDDLRGANLVVIDASGGMQTDRIAQRARACGALVNIIDRPAACDFHFNAIVNRNPVVVGISTAGAAPVLAQAIRRRLEAVLPQSIGAWAAAVKALRGSLHERLPHRRQQREFWERFADMSLAPVSGKLGPAAELARLVEDLSSMSAPRSANVGEVIFVGAGPGDPEHLTLKAVRELQAADAIVHDRLVLPSVLELGRREARRILAAKQGHGDSCRQEDISSLIVRLALDGNRVVRLKGGDPTLFGRLAEEIAACRAACIPVRIVPGITAASAAAARLALPLTDRNGVQRVQFVTGHDRNAELPGDLDFKALADARATTVVYMGRRTASGLAAALIEQGLAASTPAVVLSNVARADEAARFANLSLLASPGFLDNDPEPAIILIGNVLTLSAERIGPAPAVAP